MNHHGLLIKLMERHIPIKILCILENWFAISVTCIKWSDIISNFSAWQVAFVKVEYNCRHIFLHVLLTVWLIRYKQAGLDAMSIWRAWVSRCTPMTYYWCLRLLVLFGVFWVFVRQNMIGLTCALILILILNHMFDLVPATVQKCRNILTSYNFKLVWSDSVRYLGVFFLRSARSFACSYSYSKNGMYRAFNALFGKVGRVASSDVVVQLVKTKCLYTHTVLCYWSVFSLEYVIDTCFRKIFNVKSEEVVHECETEFGVFPVSDIIDSIGKVNFSWSMTIPITCYASCAKFLTKLFDFCFRVHSLYVVTFIFHIL